MRPYTLVLNATANKAGTDSEHPWPGYLSLIDMLYARNVGATSDYSDRSFNLVYALPVASSVFISRLNHVNPPTAAYIVDNFADAIVLDGGLVAGRPIRGNQVAVPA